MVRAVGLATVPGKLRAARTWENRLRDPSTSAQVPPLGGHLISAQRLTTARAAWHTVALGLATGALLLLTLAAFRGALPVEDERGRLGPGLALFTVLVGTVWLFAIRQLCVTRRRWRVERLSASSTDRPAAPAERRTATTVPALTVHLAGPLRGRRVTVHRQRRPVGRRAGRRRPAESQGFPAHGLLCHGSYWQRAVTRLLLEVDQVFLDLTGFHPDHRGTAFELQAALDLVDVGRLRLIAGAECDQLFLVAQLRAAWRAMLPGSPNARSGSRTLTLHVG